MKWFLSDLKYYLALVIIGLLVNNVQAQNGYERRIEKYRSQWEKLIPAYSKIQYAGGMGLLSFGTGWDYGKNNQWETDVFMGFLPKYSTSDFKVTFTLKQNFIPWKKPLGHNLSVDPLACGMYVTTILNDDFWTSEPDKYPNDYYSFSSKLRFNLYVGQRLTYKIPSQKRFFAETVTLFYELGTNELYIISAAGNSYLKPTDYIKLSLGMKFLFF
ncbi:hypothetical protein M2132_001202 [Dysgonomonas sp. PH5-45]|uniref:hypothetical protein n=1 Tax=unclassified Dysgonomonas TaxID=2630389 RepID=UPI002475F96B|nr:MULTISPECIES: hypothetical protein [unclassified Dysgonomonas]MDH6354869.1 hypothetical protein [Dysgonomonas sp. PH5-45]MDH6387768.1 hypothetical protein [Dysgonomonas sp. PH5-37]